MKRADSERIITYSYMQLSGLRALTYASTTNICTDLMYSTRSYWRVARLKGSKVCICRHKLSIDWHFYKSTNVKQLQLQPNYEISLRAEPS